MNTAAQHAELMHKVENYNILLDSNKLLREEKNQLQTQLTQTEAKVYLISDKAIDSWAWLNGLFQKV